MSQKVVLLVNENPKTSRMLASFLEDEGYEVLLADREMRCYQYLANRNIDIVLLDLMRDDLQGLMLTKKIKALSKHKRTPIISLTRDNLFSGPTNIPWGCDEYLLKPVDRKSLIKKMEFLMDKYFY